MKIIAIVDDSKAVRQSLAHTLEEAGYKVLQYEDGAQALDGLKETGEAVELIFTDFNMPNANGIELTKRLRALPDYRKTPIVMLTTESQEPKMAAGRAVGVTAWIVKPFGTDKIIEMTKHFLG